MNLNRKEEKVEKDSYTNNSSTNITHYSMNLSNTKNKHQLLNLKPKK